MFERIFKFFDKDGILPDDKVARAAIRNSYIAIAISVISAIVYLIFILKPYL